MQIVMFYISLLIPHYGDVYSLPTHQIPVGQKCTYNKEQPMLIGAERFPNVPNLIRQFDQSNSDAVVYTASIKRRSVVKCFEPNLSLFERQDMGRSKENSPDVKKKVVYFHLGIVNCTDTQRYLCKQLFKNKTIFG